MMVASDPTAPRAERRNYWQDWANAGVAVWLLVSPWLLQFGADGNAAPTAMGAAVQAATWNARILGVLVLLVAVSAIGRMDFWQEYINLVLAIWVFIAPWMLGFAQLPRAGWDHWIVGGLIFLLSISVLSRTRRVRMVLPAGSSDSTTNRPPGI
jgi:hypothetical protein